MGVLFLFCSSAFALPYIGTIPGGALTDEAYWEEDPSYGSAGLKCWYWQEGDYWYYTYQIDKKTLEYEGTPKNDAEPPIGYHLGWYDFSSVATYDGIYKFSLSGFEDGIGNTPDVMEATGLGGSTSTGNAWGIYPDGDNTGMDWWLSELDAINPTRWEYVGQSTKDWIKYYGDTSLGGDAGGQYFQIVSDWGPGDVVASITTNDTPPQHQPSTTIIGPAVIPEPCSFVILGIGASVLLSNRRKKKRLF